MQIEDYEEKSTYKILFLHFQLESVRYDSKSKADRQIYDAGWWYEYL